MATLEIWRKRFLAFALIALLMLGGSRVAAADVLDTLQSTIQTYNVVTFGDFGPFSADTQGPAAIGGNAYLSNFGVATSSTNGQYALTVGGTLYGTNGQINGNLWTQNAPVFSSVGVTGTTTVGGLGPIRFPTLQSSITQAAMLLSQQAANGTANLVGSTLTLTGGQSGMNVFSVNGALLGGVTSIAINIPTGATAVVNVSGASVLLGLSGLGFNYADMQKVLYNFYGATSLTVTQTSFMGSILAPLAAVNFNNANINGAMIADSIAGGGEYHNFLFNGSLNPTPEPATMALLGTGLLVVFGKVRHNARRRKRQSIVL